jgi:hypothetical protein
MDAGLCGRLTVCPSRHGTGQYIAAGGELRQARWAAVFEDHAREFPIDFDAKNWPA